MTTLGLGQVLDLVGKQDLANQLGTFLGFQVAYGRCQDAAGQVDHDGHWASPTGCRIVNKHHPAIFHTEEYSWVFHLTDVRLYLDAPVVIDRALREQLDAFQDRDLEKRWSWFVQAAHRLSPHDFALLTGQTRST